VARIPSVGIQLPEVEREVRWPEYVAMARAAQEVGFDSIWVGDHLLYRGDDRPERGPWEAWTLLAGLAVATTRVRLGPLVACLGFHPPAVLAKMAATVDELSGGRLVLGVGAGWNRVEFDAFGIPFDRRAARFAEAFEIVRRLVAGERVTWAGEHHRVDDAVLAPSPARPIPLMVGSTGERVLTHALPHVDAWNTWFDWYGNSPEGFDQANRRISDLARATGRDPSTLRRSACVLVQVDDAATERPRPRDFDPVSAQADRLTAHLGALGEAGADEAILVANPITEASIRTLGRALTGVLGRQPPDAPPLPRSV
jgi:probable F420-dependent oxidoreductase